MTKDEASVGLRIRTKSAFVSVPKGTEGVIDEISCGLWMIAWDLPEGPLPAGYRKFDGVPSAQSGILRDGFNDDELEYLEEVPDVR